MIEFVIIISHNFDQVDEQNQEISMKIENLVSWTDSRITLNESHSFWRTKINTIWWLKLPGKFVDDCLWTPESYYHRITDFSTFNPTSTKETGSPFEHYLNHPGELISWMRESKFTLSCSMDFDFYPMDNQVTVITI